MHTDPINHDPAVTFLLTGNQQPGRPTLGSWVSYGLGSENKNLPEYVILLSGGGGQPLHSRYWGNGFLPSKYQGVSLRSTGDPVLYVSNPEGIDPAVRRRLLDGLKELNQIRLDTVGDPEIAAQDQLVRDGLPDAVQRPRADGHRQGTGRSRRHVRRDARQRLVRQQLPARPPPGRARRPVRPALPPRLGPPLRPAQGTQAPVRPDRQARRGPGQGPQTPRPARRDAGDLGRGIRPDRLQPGGDHPDRISAATTILDASPCGWPGAGSRAAR